MVLDTFESYDANTDFTMKIEEQYKISFLDTLFIRKDAHPIIYWFQRILRLMDIELYSYELS